MAPKIAVIYYSMYGHIKQLADAEVKGIEEAGGKADLYQVKETLPQEVLAKMHVPEQSKDIPFITAEKLKEYDAFLMGIPTRYGNFPAQWKTFWDSTGKMWLTGGYWGKYGGFFVSTSSQGGGQEATAIAAVSTFVHHGIIYVPLGYAKAFEPMAETKEVKGGTPWGAGTIAGSQGELTPSALELDIAKIQGKEFYGTVAKAFH